MHRRILIAIAGCCVVHAATTCPSIPPCSRLHPEAIFFVGTVTDAPSLNGAIARPVRFQVDEAFMGVPVGVQEMVITTDAVWLVKGHSYLIDAYERSQNWLDLTSCGASGEPSSEPAKAMLLFLRQRAKGLPQASLNVGTMALDQLTLLADALVTVKGSMGALTARTNSEGVATFEGLPPGYYGLSARLPYYHISDTSPSDMNVEIEAGGCASADIILESDSSVSGVLRGSKGVAIPGIDLLLVPIAQTPSALGASRDAEGRFHFKSVAPGTYILGVNLMGLQPSVTPSYYPNVPDRQHATPIKVSPGEHVRDLQLNLLDPPAARTIEVCAVDEKGKPVASARILNFRQRDVLFPALDVDRMTDETGCMIATGFARTQYAIYGSKRFYTGDPSLESHHFVIEPGDTPAHVRLVLKQIP